MQSDTKVVMRGAVIYRATGRNSFAVQMQHWPGVVEIHCANICTKDRVQFDQMAACISAVDTSSLVHVSVTLGEYCLRKRAFVHCSMHYPPVEEVQDPADEWYPIIQHMQSDLAAKKQPSPRKRERFTTYSQTNCVPY
jgi:hypothetical protein